MVTHALHIDLLCPSNYERVSSTIFSLILPRDYTIFTSINLSSPGLSVSSLPILPSWLGFYLYNMSLWLSEVSGLLVNTQKHVLSVARELCSVLEGEVSIQGDTHILHCKSIIIFFTEGRI